MTDSLLYFNEKLNQYFNSHPVFLFSKGRVGLYAVLKSLGIQPGDEIILPGYTCLVVPSAFLVLGAKPIYIDIDPSTYNIAIDLIESRITPKTKVIIIQHTYGIPCEFHEIQQLAKKYGLTIIEDCCHAFGSEIHNHRCGRLGDAAFLSGQWNKPFSTGLGGMLVVNHTELAKRVQSLVDKELIPPSSLYNLKIAFQILLYDWLVNPKTASIITNLYRLASKMGLLVGSSTQGELVGQLPDDYFMGMAPAQAKRGLRELARIETNISHRREIAKIYQDTLSTLGFAPVRLKDGCKPVFLRYPVRVQNKDEVLDLSLHHGMEIGSWFESPMHPEKVDMSKFGYQLGSCQEAERASREVINLPTHIKVTAKEAHRILNFLHRVAKPCNETFP